MTTSTKYNIDWRDLLNSALIAAVVAFVATGGQMLEAWVKSPDLMFDKISMILSLKAAFAGFVAYLFKAWVTPQKNIVK